MGMLSRAFRAGPIALSATTTTNLLNPGTTTGGTNCTSTPFNALRLVIRHVRIVNNDSSDHTFSMWLSTTGDNTAGKEVFGSGTTVPANSCVDFYDMLVMSTADFIVGGADTANKLSVIFEGEIGVA